MKSLKPSRTVFRESKSKAWLADTPCRRSSARIAVLAAVLGCAILVVPAAQASSIHILASSFGGSFSTVADPYPLGGPSDVAIDESTGPSHGDLYVTDPGNFRVEKFDSAGHFLLVFGKEVNRTKVEAKASEAEQNVCAVASGDECQSGTNGKKAVVSLRSAVRGGGRLDKRLGRRCVRRRCGHRHGLQVPGGHLFLRERFRNAGRPVS